MSIDGLTFVENAEYANLLHNKVILKHDGGDATLIIDARVRCDFQAASEALFYSPGFTRIVVYAPPTMVFPAYFIRAVKTWMELVGGEYRCTNKGSPAACAELEHSEGIPCFILGLQGDQYCKTLPLPKVSPPPEAISILFGKRRLGMQLAPGGSCIEALVGLVPEIANPAFAIISAKRSAATLVVQVGPRKFVSAVEAPPPIRPTRVAPPPVPVTNTDTLQQYFIDLNKSVSGAFSDQLSGAVMRAEPAMPKAVYLKMKKDAVMSRMRNLIKNPNAINTLQTNYTALVNILFSDSERGNRIIAALHTSSD